MTYDRWKTRSLDDELPGEPPEAWEVITDTMIDKALNAWFASPPSETDQGLERSMRAALQAAEVPAVSAIRNYLAAFDRCGGSESVSAEEFAECRAAMRRAVNDCGVALPPPQVDSGREEIARIIDPCAFEDAMLQDDLTPSERMCFSANRETEKLNALAKADAILTLSHNGTRKET